MIYGYGLWDEVEKRIKKENPDLAIRNLQKYNKVKQMFAKGDLKPTDLLFFLRFSNGDQKLQKELSEQGYHLFPNPVFSFFLQDRETYLSKIDSWTKYPLKRIYIDGVGSTSLKLIEKNFGSKPVVLKVGNLHASEGKWLVDEKRILPYLKYKMKKLPTTIEEFVPEARSIRIGIVGDANERKNYYITEHINSKTWLKNNAPEEEITYSYEERYKTDIPHIDSLIEESKEIAKRYGADIIGVDWVVGKEKTGLLEVNDMIGIPDGDFAVGLFYREVMKRIKTYNK